MRLLKKCTCTARVCAMQIFDGNLLSVCAEYIVYFLRFFLLCLLWRSLAGEGAVLDDMPLESLLTYTLMASILRQQLEIITPATSALWEGSVIGRYMRPMPVISSFAAETVGRWWIPVFLIYSLPLWLLAPLLGINPLPHSFVSGMWFLLSLVLSVSLGFAVDLLFAAFAMHLKNGCWAALMVRESVTTLFSGALIPFALLPWNLGRVFALLPLGSIGNAPLSLYVGQGQALPLLGLQLFWNALLWPLALKIFHNSQERMVSFGG